ncbi:MAG: response regulator [Lachnospiraceae bacterium]|nr:response regulator [Lachnospiraceae bacterium]
MIRYEISALVSFALFFMGTVALLLGLSSFFKNTSSKPGKRMLLACISIFVWDFGYGWMGLCHGSEFAYIPRAIGLIAVIVYICAVLSYLTILSGFPKKVTASVCTISCVLFFVSWWYMIQKDAVTFVETSWGYWYYSKKIPARYVETLAVGIALVFFYVILIRWNKNAEYKREKHLIKRFSWFGPLLVIGLILDTYIPLLAGTPAIPGSVIFAFLSSMLLFNISQGYMAFGISESNVSGYVFREVNVPVIILDPKGYIELYNEQAGSSLARFDTLKGKRLEEIIEPVSNLTYVPDEYKSWLMSVKGREAYCRLIRSVIYDEFNEIICEIIFLPDMTDAILSMQMAYESRRQAEEANKAKSNFLANMSHEIRTPMNAIIGMSDIMLADKSISDGTREQLNVIKTAGDGLLELINDILDISKIESGKYEIINEEYDLAKLIYDVSMIIRTRLEGSGVDLKLYIYSDMPVRVIGDELRVRQILMNILGNAVKFTKEGSIEFKCECRRLTDDYVFYIDVTDTGIGIKEENFKTIFGVFNQVDTRKNRNIQGTGLGLAISRDLAIMMNGDITVDSEYGKGSTFHITFHQQAADEVLLGPKRAMELEQFTYSTSEEGGRPEEKKYDYSDKKVLIVDDNLVNLQVSKVLLENCGLNTDTAENGMKAIEMVKNGDYDLVFMDHMMPELDGVDTTKLIRCLDDEKSRNVPIVALTADVVAGTREMLLEEGMQDFLAKPIKEAELKAILRKWL